jgi:hypothetical protein
MRLSDGGMNLAIYVIIYGNVYYKYMPIKMF